MKNKRIIWNKGTKGLCKANSGSFTSEKTKGNTNGFKKGNHPKSQFKKGIIPWNKGKHGLMPVPWNKGIGNKTPENKKIRNSIEFRLWREAVFARDNWVCQKTGVRGGKIHPHHIQNFAKFPELRFAIDNGITLSEKSHKQFHRKYGNRNNTKEQIEEFLAA